MNTPICDFVKKYAESNPSRLHMPGHKGKGFLGFEHLDITEVEGADVLYNAEGIIKESMENASSLFGTAKTLYSTEGSSLSIRAMLYLTALYAKEQQQKPLILAGRNAHKAFLSGVALSDIEVEWIYPDENEGLLSLCITPEKLESYLGNYSEKPVALYVTSPDYLGNTLDIEALSKVCKKHNMLLLVDNAHGAYLNFLPENRHPVALGADICCDSAHKTLPVLTGGGYLHISESAPEIFKTQAESAMSLFASTSPSYLILQSLDTANRYMADGYKEGLSAFIEKVDNLKHTLIRKGYGLFGNEALKLTISAKEYGYKGYELAEILAKNGIICEFADSDFLTLMFTPENSVSDLEKLENTLLSVEKREALTSVFPKNVKLKRAMSIREALFSSSCEVSSKDAEGKILANYTVSCPPAIPVAICGEIITKEAIETFLYYGIEKIRIIN